MAPVVHGLEQEYTDRVDFLYLNVSEARNDSAKQALGFTTTPHFFFLDQDGKAVQSMQGVVPGDSLRNALDALMAEHPLDVRQ